MSNHKHHIVPKYKCEELGLTTSYKIDGIEFYFKENMVEVPREQHALIHWGYKCNDLKPLLEVCNPPQWVIDMIPLGDNRDSGAASYITKLSTNIDTSGEANPMWKGGISYDMKAYRKAYNQTPKFKESRRVTLQRPEYKAKKKAYDKVHSQIPENKAKNKAYEQTPEVRARRKATRLRNKLEKQQGQGTLNQFLG